MRKQVIMKGILDTVGNTAAQLKDDTTGEQYVVCKLNSADPLDAVLPPIKYGSMVSVKSAIPQAEVSQILLVGYGTDETVVASTSYKTRLTQLLRRKKGDTPVTFPYSYTSPAVLTGTAATDRHNMYSALATKINNHTTNYVSAAVLYKVAYTGGTDGAGTATDITCGETGTQETSTETASIAGITITSGTLAGNDAAGFIYLYSFSDLSSWLATSKTITMGTSLIVVTTAATPTAGAGLVVEDDAGYYGANPSVRTGASNFETLENFETAVVTTGLAFAYSRGIGSRMIQDVPVMTIGGDDVVTGDYEFQLLGGSVDASKTYGTIKITVNNGAVADGLLSAEMTNPIVYTLYADYANTTYYGLLVTALQAMTK